MTDPIVLPGVRSSTLLGYLKGLGLLTIVARQADATAAISWRDGELQLHAALDEEQLERFLLDAWVPAPIVSPWNGGSGFYPGDNATALDAIRASDAPRLAPLRSAIDTAHRVITDQGLTAKPDPQAQKPALLRALRATLADDALAWLDAAVVLQDDGISYPPALGSGGNDGRYDFANNYAQSVWSAITSDDRGATLRGALLGDPVALTRKLSLAHLTRDASPVNSPGGESDALGNPWDLVLALHGALLWSAGATRRLGAVRAGHAAPFTLLPSAAGYGSAVPGEKGRRELWMPTWDRPARHTEVEALFREGRAQVGRRQAATGLDAARAAGELGVARGVTGFERIVVLERAGLSNLAVHAGRVDVRPNPAAEALATLDPWLAAVLRHGAGDAPRSQRFAIRELEHAAFALAEGATADRAASMLSAIGHVEMALGRARDTDRPHGLRPLRAPAGPWVALLDRASPTHRLAVGLASLRDHERRADTIALREALTGFGDRYEHRTGWIAPTAAPLHERLARILERRWLTMDERPGFSAGMRVRIADLERFAAGAVEEDLGALVYGLVRMDWRGDVPPMTAPHDPAWPPDPLVRLLLLAVHAKPVLDETCHLGRDWATQIRSGGAHLRRARDAAHRHLVLSGRAPIAPAEDVQPRDDAAGRWIAAALLARPSLRDLDDIDVLMTHSPNQQEESPPVESPA